MVKIGRLIRNIVFIWRINFFLANLRNNSEWVQESSSICKEAVYVKSLLNDINQTKPNMDKLDKLDELVLSYSEKSTLNHIRYEWTHKFPTSSWNILELKTWLEISWGKIFTPNIIILWKYCKWENKLLLKLYFVKSVYSNTEMFLNVSTHICLLWRI